MILLSFNNLEDYLTFVDQATRDGVRVELRSGLVVAVPDGYDQRGKTSAEIEAEMTVAEPEPEPEPEPEFEPEDEGPPPHGATKAEWVNYAESRGIDTTDMTKDEVISTVEGE